jgi:hypothetical protein
MINGARYRKYLPRLVAGFGKSCEKFFIVYNLASIVKICQTEPRKKRSKRDAGKHVRMCVPMFIVNVLID